MPNWCENTLSVSGPAEELKRVREFANPLSAELFLPIPEELKSITRIGPPSGGKCYTNENGHVMVDFAGVDIWQCPRYRTVGGQDIPLTDEEQNALFEKYETRDVREWACKNWGTKWDFCDCEVEKHSDMIVYHFNTAWGPPTPVIEKIAKMHPSLSFLFSFGGVEIEFAGSMLFIKGDRLFYKYIEFNPDWELDNEEELPNPFYESFPEIFSKHKLSIYNPCDIIGRK